MLHIVDSLISVKLVSSYYICKRFDLNKLEKLLVIVVKTVSSAEVFSRCIELTVFLCLNAAENRWEIFLPSAF